MDAWASLRQFTQARIAQGKSGCSTPTAALLEFQIAHAAARDAVLEPWHTRPFAQELESLGVPVLNLETQASTRPQYLLRPDFGRRLNAESRQSLLSAAPEPVDVAIIMTNGLSSTALNQHGLGLLQALRSALSRQGLTTAPVSLVANGRVALSDEIGELLNARLAIMLVGERPGLSAADSMGIYLTYGPRVGRTDADRNCISNIRPPEGLSYAEAADKATYLVMRALQEQYSGVALKDDMPNASWLVDASPPAEPCLTLDDGAGSEG